LEISGRITRPNGFRVLGCGSAWAPEKIMPRPKRIKEPAKINLLIERDIKLKAVELAAQRRISVGRLFENWLIQDLNGSQSNGSSYNE
jgi:hypothetical protein